MKLSKLLITLALCLFAPLTISANGHNSPGPSERQGDMLEAKIARLQADLQGGAYGLVDEVLLQQDGKTVFHFRFDRDYDGIVAGQELVDGPFVYNNPKWHPYYDGTELHTLQSVTKSVTSVLIGILEYREAIPSAAEARLLDLVSDKYTTANRDANFEALTLEHVLEMRTSLEWDETSDYSPGSTNDAVILEQETDDWVQYVLNKPLEGKPGTSYEYNSGASQLLSAIIRKASGQQAAEFAEGALFAPLGIEDYYWKTSPVGESDTLGGLYLKSTDLIKFCELMSSGGMYGGERLLSGDYVRRSLRYATTFEDHSWSRGYGYQWWLGDHASDSDTAFSGSGYGGQHPTCWPATNTALVIFSWNLPDVLGVDESVARTGASREIRRRIHEEILPLLGE